MSLLKYQPEDVPEVRRSTAMIFHIPLCTPLPEHVPPRHFRLRPLPHPPHPWDHEKHVINQLWQLYSMYPLAMPSDHHEHSEFTYLEWLVLAELHGIPTSPPPKVHSSFPTSMALGSVLRRFRLASRFAFTHCVHPAECLLVKASTARASRLKPLGIAARTSAIAFFPILPDPLPSLITRALLAARGSSDPATVCAHGEGALALRPSNFRVQC